MDKNHTSIRLFENSFLESLTHVHPLVPLFMWGPFVAYLLINHFVNTSASLWELATMAPLGLFVWTFIEYFLHRFVFHFNGKSALAKRFVFMFHGLHHDDPEDPTRLVMPPVPAIIIMFLLWKFFALFFSSYSLPVFMAFFILGYLCYDYIHYATHHFPMTSSLGKFLRKYHLQHHYSKEESKFGVSNPLWDYIFQTMRGPKK